VSVTSHERERSCIVCVMVSILFLSTILIFPFRIIPTVWYLVFCFFLLFILIFRTEQQNYFNNTREIRPPFLFENVSDRGYFNTS